MKINWADNAIQDLSEIKTYISRDSEFYASRFVNKLIDGVKNLFHSIKPRPLDVVRGNWLRRFADLPT